jgi:hypothetical protein
MVLSPDVFFPCGEQVQGDMSEVFAETLLTSFLQHGYIKHLGFYTVEIDQYNLIEEHKPIIIPFRDGPDTYYNCDRAIHQILSLNSSDISSLLKHKCKVTFLIGKEYIFWRDAIENHNLFGFLHRLLKDKTQQDLKKHRGDTDYNTFIREVCKKTINLLSGLMFKNVTNDRTLVASRLEYEVGTLIYPKSRDQLQPVFIKHEISDKTVIIKYSVDQSTMGKRLSPVYIGSFIYSYASD